MNNTCIKCGMTTSDNQQLCESCINREITLDKMYEFYIQIKIIDIYKNNISNLKNQLAKVCIQKPSISSILIIILAWVGIPCYWVLITILMGIITGFSDDKNLVNLIMLTSLLISTIIAILITCILGYRYWVYRTKFYDDRDVEIARIKNLIDAEQNKLDSTYENTNRYIPKAYMEPKIVLILIQLIELKRADSLKEAINLFESIKNTQTMIQLQSEINRNTVDTANAAAISAVANVITAYNTRR